MPEKSLPDNAVTISDTLIVRGRTVAGFGDLTPALALSLQRAMLDAANDCGCKTGAAGAAAALFVYAFVKGILPWLYSQPIGLHWLDGALIALSAAIIGKALGLHLADRRLENSIDRFNAIHRAISPVPSRHLRAHRRG
jgi:hypothetical protein